MTYTREFPILAYNVTRTILASPIVSGNSMIFTLRCRFSTATLSWDVPPLYSQSLIGTIIGGTVMPIKDCEYKGEHPKP